MRSGLNVLILYSLITGLGLTTAKAQTFIALLAKADSLVAQANYEQAESTYQQALAKSGKLKHTGVVYLRMGSMYQNRSLYRKALDYFFESRKLFESIGSENNISAAMLNIEDIYRILQNMDLASKYADSAYNKLLRIKDSVNIPYALNDLGAICLEQKDIDKALSYFRSILTDYRNYATEDLKNTTIFNIGLCYMKQRKYALSLDYYKEAYKRQKKTNDSYSLAYTLCGMAEVYNKMHNYAKALEVQRQSMILAAAASSKQLMKSGYDNYADIYKNMGNYKQAYRAAMKSHEWTDSINNEKRKEYNIAEADYDREQEKLRGEQQKERNRLLSKEIKQGKLLLLQERQLLLTVTVIAILVLLSTYFFYRTYRIRQHNERMLEKQRSTVLENQLKDSELTALRAQMNPHFIFNALSSIKNYMLEQNIRLADYYLGKFAKLIRLILDNSSENFVSLEKELQLLESYIQLEQLRFENKFSYALQIDKEINTMETFIPSMIIQPFVENAIIHGFMHKEGVCHLDINIIRSHDFLTVAIQDNGIGRTQSAQIKSHAGSTMHQSKGYKISEQRLNVLSRNSKTRAGIAFKDMEDGKGNTGTRVEINIPLQLSVAE